MQQAWWLNQKSLHIAQLQACAVTLHPGSCPYAAALHMLKLAPKPGLYVLLRMASLVFACSIVITPPDHHGSHSHPLTHCTSATTQILNLMHNLQHIHSLYATGHFRLVCLIMGGGPLQINTHWARCRGWVLDQKPVCLSNRAIVAVVAVGHNWR